MSDQWVIPTGLAVYENRDRIAVLWDDLVTRFFGRKYSIAVTGVSGVGKTDLFNHLLGLPQKDGAAPTQPSVEVEDATKRHQKRRLHVTTVPGQHHNGRYAALGQLLGDDDPVDGIIHVVANGFVTLRQDAVKKLLSEKPSTATLDGFQRVPTRAGNR